ncbi:MAG: hypothetical protein M3Y56_08155, partial [Armatimonadota bacterium]|nr:hypothetical protein [Armatimonadota bacterium]
GELIYLNLPLHPGSKADTIPPTAPLLVQKGKGENMGYPGIEVTWTGGTDNNWISYYEVFRDGERIGRAAKGLFLFDHSAGADLAALYEVCTVDGAGNRSGRTLAAGPSAARSQIIDDAPGGLITYTGAWQRHDGQQGAFRGTLSSSGEKDAYAELTFSGTRILVFAKLGANGGLAAIQVDNDPPETVDTFSADEIGVVCIYQKEFSTANRRILRITVLAQHSAHAADSVVTLDGVRVEQ